MARTSLTRVFTLGNILFGSNRQSGVTATIYSTKEEVKQIQQELGRGVPKSNSSMT